MTLRVSSLFVAFSCAAFASAAPTYLALGDSVAYGFQPIPGNPFGNAPSNGDRGYVAAIADALGAGGTRPTVINLAIPAETSTSFRDLSNVFRGANTNYGPNIFAPRQITQSDFAAEKIGLLGSSIETVSFALGANDLLSLLDASFLALAPAQQQALLAQKLQTIASEYATDLTLLRTALPTATLILPGYYNPYPAGSPLGTFGALAITSLNSGIQSAAVAFGGRYVDFYNPILGHELQYTHIGDQTSDIHPNDAGYRVLGQAAAQAVPEPSAIAALGFGVVALLRRRRM